MLKRKRRLSIIIVAVAALVTIGGGLLWLSFSSSSPATIKGRWYTAVQVSHGEELYTAHCLTCHGVRGRATPNWRERLPNGDYPPPPLNGTAHTWHHPLAQLRRTLADGGAPFGGTMPPFRNTLNREDRDAVLAYIQSLWPERVYRLWEQRVNK